MAEWLFHKLVWVHIVSGSVGLATFWVAILSRKGAKTHKKWGKVFAWALIFTGFVATGISFCTLIAPLETHPFSDDAPLVRGIFGWMMLYLAVMTINLAWYGIACIRNKHAHAKNRNALLFILQALTLVTAVNCLVHGVLLGQSLMVGISIVGIAASLLNTQFMLSEAPAAQEWLIQHTRGLVGAGISVYTAFLAFGAVNLLPKYALNPALWATPTVLGVTYLLYHQARIVRTRQRLEARQRHARSLT
ncbi:MAG: hypothetical protein AAGA84_02910 [Pseudomonadota bacterium]